MSLPVAICWFRRDLRLKDNAALYYALKCGLPVVPVFIFDRNILDDLEDKTDRRVEFIHAALCEMQEQLVQMNSSIEVFYGTPIEAFKTLLKKYQVEKVFTNHDYEVYAKKRDAEVAALLKEHHVSFDTYKDHVIFEKNEVTKEDKTPYAVFTPYSRRWKATLNDFYLKAYPTEKNFQYLFKQPATIIPSLTSIGFAPVDKPFPSKQLEDELIRRYNKTRDYPAIDGTSRIGVHLRFGTISIRELARRALALNETFLNELIWRDFYHMILWHFPHVGLGESFRKEYDLIRWRNNETEFERWCNGTTGFPIVDAGMRELNATGYMHNRVRMITASFLVKDLLIDWRWGEAYFAKRLLDFDFAANNGGWQWAAGSGCDAAPYFRIFNPTRQAATFDKDHAYIKKWIPELERFDYPLPMVDHEMARARCLETYKKALR